MRIVIFGNCSGFGGAQTALRHLVNFLLTEGHTVGAIGLVGPADQVPGEGKAAFTSRIGNAAGRVGKSWQTLVAALKARRLKPELFVTVGLANSANLISRLLPSHTFRVCQDFIFGRDCDEALLTSSKRAFDALAVQAPSMAGALRKRNYDALPLSWLPCFPDPPLNGFQRAARNDRLGVRLAYFGRLAPNKGIDLLLQAISTAKLAVPVTFDIWGSGSEFEKWQQLASSLRLGSTVQFCGRYPEGADYARLMCSYDGLVLPSTGIEGLPLILLEVMAYGVPFLTTRVGAIPDCCVNNEDTMLVEPSVDGLRTGLEQFVARAAADGFSVQRLIRYYKAHFSFDVMADRWRRMLANPESFFSANA